MDKEGIQPRPVQPKKLVKKWLARHAQAPNEPKEPASMPAIPPPIVTNEDEFPRLGNAWQTVKLKSAAKGGISPKQVMTSTENGVDPLANAPIPSQITQQEGENSKSRKEGRETDPPDSTYKR